MLAALVKGFDWEDILGLVDYYKIQVTKLGVDIRLGQEVDRSVVEEVKPDILITTREGKKQTIEVDTIVTALPLLPNAELFKSLEGSAPEIYNIGDCKELNLTLDAIVDEARIARAI